MTVDTQPDEDAQPDRADTVAGTETEATAPFLVPPSWGLAPLPTPATPATSRWSSDRRILALIAIVALLAGSAGALVSDAVHGTSRVPTAATGTTTIVASPPVGQALQGADIVAGAEPAVVTIEVTVPQHTGLGTTTATAAGTGLILTAAGLVATNAHVVAGAESIAVTLTGRSAVHTARLVGEDTGADLALLQVAGATGLPVARLGDSASIRVGDDVLAIGNALDLAGDLTVSRGIVSALNRSVQSQSATLTGLIQTDAAISSGNSGGPLLNSSGQVIGINTLAMTSTRGTTAENIGFAIPVNNALTVLRRLGFSQTKT
ncbi:MAG: S1C family serine protease [Acidimicrobiales bacterium]